MEVFEIKMIEGMIKKYGAFVSNVTFDFPKSVLEIKVRGNDAPLKTITTVRPRKKVKLNA